ncbi:MAG: hypothetical protein HYZ34_11670, partial [Ignavibacteriae bacterium]|nr:hypothetical protein [Ignavibacteriota bacterium]
MKFNFKILSFLLVFTLTILTAQSQMPIVLEDATVIDSWNTVPVTNCYIVITGNKISNIGKSNEIVIPENAQKFNMKGKYVIPGLVDVASRFRSEKELNQLLSWGVTGTNYLFESIKEARQLSLRTKPDTARTPEVYITTPVFGASG